MCACTISVSAFKHLSQWSFLIGDQEIESEASEVSTKDGSVAVTKQGDVSDEEEIEVVEGEDQKDMREFLQSEEGRKWLQDNPDKKVASYGSSDDCETSPSLPSCSSGV